MDAATERLDTVRYKDREWVNLGAPMLRATFQQQAPATVVTNSRAPGLPRPTAPLPDGFLHVHLFTTEGRMMSVRRRQP